MTWSAIWFCISTARHTFFKLCFHSTNSNCGQPSQQQCCPFPWTSRKSKFEKMIELVPFLSCFIQNHHNCTKAVKCQASKTSKILSKNESANLSLVILVLETLDLPNHHIFVPVHFNHCLHFAAALDYWTPTCLKPNEDPFTLHFSLEMDWFSECNISHAAWKVNTIQKSHKAWKC